MATILSVATRRDGFDWALWCVGFAAASVALFGFVEWVREQRRRPEVEFLWLVSTDGQEASLEPWPSDKTISIRSGQSLIVEVSIRNVGNATGARSITNFVVPAVLDLGRVRQGGGGGVRVQNKIAGLPPNFGANYLHDGTDWYPNLWWQQRFRVTLTPGERVPPKMRLLMEVSDDRLSPRGRPRRAFGWSQGEPDAGAGEPWPSGSAAKPRFQRIEPLPEGRPWCGPGWRRDIRDLSGEDAAPVAG